MGEQAECANLGCTRLQAKRDATSWHNWCSRCKRQQQNSQPLDEGIEAIRRTYCQNSMGEGKFSDGSPLNFECRTNHDDDGTLPSYDLILDHIDGDRSNSDPDNFQTLCLTCDKEKSKLAGEWNPHR